MVGQHWTVYLCQETFWWKWEIQPTARQAHLLPELLSNRSQRFPRNAKVIAKSDHIIQQGKLRQRDLTRTLKWFSARKDSSRPSSWSPHAHNRRDHTGHVCGPLILIHRHRCPGFPAHHRKSTAIHWACQRPGAARRKWGRATAQQRERRKAQLRCTPSKQQSRHHRTNFTSGRRHECHNHHVRHHHGSWRPKWCHQWCQQCASYFKAATSTQSPNLRAQTSPCYGRCWLRHTPGPQDSFKQIFGGRFRKGFLVTDFKKRERDN